MCPLVAWLIGVFSLRLAVFLNLVLTISFVLSSIYVDNFISTTSVTYDGQGGYGIPNVAVNVFTISIGYNFYLNGIPQGGPLPTTIPNFPFFIFWMFVVINLILVWAILRTTKQKSVNQKTAGPMGFEPMTFSLEG